MTLTALTRPPTAALARCELTHLTRQPIDLDRAITQHAAYERVLAELGVAVVSLTPEPELPDAVFVEDTAVVLDDVAVLMRSGAASRRPEVATVAEVLERYRALETLEAPATLDGGDVLRVGDLLLVGVSSRTNADGLRQFGAIARRHGYQTRPVPVAGPALHLKSACTHVGGGLVLANTAHVDPDALADLDLLPVPETEPRAGNTVLVGDVVLMADGFPETRALLERRGRTVVTVDLSELQKAEAGGSCMSLIFGDQGPASSE